MAVYGKSPGLEFFAEQGRTRKAGLCPLNLRLFRFIGAPTVIKPRTPAGVMELLPRDQIAFQRMLDPIRQTF